MASVKNLARYIYENQKRGFSDIEIYQILEQSGWEKNDIDSAFKKAALLKSTDLMISAPIKYFKRGLMSAGKSIISLPSKILSLSRHGISGLIKNIFSLFLYVITKTTSAIKNSIFYIFVGTPGKISSKFSKRKVQKVQNEKSIAELSKYIEKNLKEGALENDIFIELLQAGWSQNIIDKAFSATHFKILKENAGSFLRLILWSPFSFIKRIIFFVASTLKKIFIDAPRAIFDVIKTIILSVIGGISRLFSYLLYSIKNLAVSTFKKPTKPIMLFKPPVEKISISKKIKLLLLRTADFCKNIPSRFATKKISIPKEKPVVAIPKPKVSSLAHFKMGVKYFIKSYPQATTRLKQKVSYSFSQSIRKSKGGLLRMVVNTINFIKYDLRIISQKIITAPILMAEKLFNIATRVSFSNLILGIPKLFLAILLSPFILIKKFFNSLIRWIKRVDLKSFNTPFEIIEFALLKIYKGLKIVVTPLGTRLKLTARHIRGLLIPASKEAEYTPQNLSEIPVGEVSDEMRPFDILRIAARMFKTRRMRTFLTILGIGIGIGAILFLVSLGYGLQRILIEEIATSDALLSLDITTRDETLIPLNKSSIKSLTDLPEVSYVSPLISVPAQISLENVTANTMVDGINPTYFKLAGITATVGELFKEGETNKIIISAPIVKLLNLRTTDGEITEEDSKNMVGQSVSITLLVPQKTQTGTEEVKTIEFDNKFEIVGVMQDSPESLIYMPLSRLEDAGITTYQSAKVRVTSTETLEPVRGKAVEMGFIVAALSDTIEQANKVFQVLQVILALFGIVALSVSAIGMFNTMTIALLERTQEIGIMKSLGASNRNVWELFLAESIIMGFLGGVGGISIGYISSEGFNLMIRLLAGALGGQKVQLFERPWWFIITILVFSTIVGLFTGLWPARRAARINILAALRYK